MKIKKPDNEVINFAISLLDNPDCRIVKDNTIESKYNSYIAGFGGCIINSGLPATLMIFESNAEKNFIIELLFELYNLKNQHNIITKTSDFYYRSILSLEINEQKKLRNELVDMAVALKLAMRCYEQVDNK